jgi:hypothetical protein
VGFLLKGNPMNARSLLLTAIACFVAAAEAQAHYLFIHIGPPAEAGRAAEVYFSEQAEAGDPRFIEKIAHTQLWLQQTPGTFQPLKVQKGEDRLRAPLPVAGSLSVVGICEYGVLGKPKAPFLLRHFPKAVAGEPAEINRLQPCDKVPLEIVPTVEAEQIRFLVLREGKPVPGAVLITVASDLSNEKLTTGADGRAAWKPPRPGKYSVYTSEVKKVAGKFRDKAYDEIRDFATLAFRWPLAPKGADAAAVALFEEAIAARASWKNFPGFKAQIKGKIDGRPFSGSVTISSKGAVELAIDDEVVDGWVQGQLESIVMHRAAREGSSKAEKPVLRFADFEEDHPLGRLLIFEGGSFASSYRVKDRQLRVVNRHLGKQYMTITVLDNEQTREGQFLPRSYTVQYWDAATGALQRTEAVTESWARLTSWDLPLHHTVTTASGNGLSVRSFTLSKHELLKAK